MYYLGYWPQEIIFSFFNINIVNNNMLMRDFKDDIIILISGPIANCIFCGAFFLPYVFYRQVWCFEFAFINLILGIFNLFPLEILDVGQIILNMLLRKFDEQKAMEIMFAISSVSFAVLVFLNVFVLIYLEQNLSLLLLSCYMLYSVLTKK
jgi:Zn-dependent protease